MIHIHMDEAQKNMATSQKWEWKGGKCAYV